MNNNNVIAPKDEPTTTAKVVIITTNGEIEIDIWANEIPLASQNFIQLALEGYYDGTIFHRVIQDFMIQGGDPTGTGMGGESVFGKPFKDEFHQRLKFGRRGMVAMANSGKDSNGSQFFITFAECSHLNKKHTIFGKVVGDSIYSLLSMQSLEVDKDDRPMYPPSIKRIKVVLNPFDNLVLRNLKPKEEKKIVKEVRREDEEKYKKNEMKKLKNKNKLTFDDEEAETEFKADKVKSSHDTLNDEKFSKKVAVTNEELEKKRKIKEEEEEKKKELARKLVDSEHKSNNESEGLAEMLKNEMMRKKGHNEESGREINDEVLNYQKRVNPETGKVELVWGNETEKQKIENQESFNMEKLRELQEREYEALKADELNFKKMKEGSAKERRKQLVAEETTLLSNAEKRRYEFLKKSKVEKREGEMLSKLNKFTERLKKSDTNDWMNHRLKFQIDSQNAYNVDKRNQERKGREDDDLDDGGLKVEYDHYELPDDELDLDELNDMAKN